MANSLGTLGEFQIADNQPEVTGMRYSGTAALPVAPPTPAGEKPLVGAGHGPELQAELEKKLAARPAADIRRTPLQIAALLHDCGQAVARLEKAAARNQPAPELAGQLKTELLNLLLAELLNLERSKAKATLESLYAVRWRRFISRLELDRFQSVDDCRRQMSELVTARPEDFVATCRRIFEAVKDKFPSDPVCPEGS